MDDTGKKQSFPTLDRHTVISFVIGVLFVLAGFWLYTLEEHDGGAMPAWAGALAYLGVGVIVYGICRKLSGAPLPGWRKGVRSKKFSEFEGDGMGKEEWIPPLPGWRKGGTFVDLTARRADGTAVRIQTIDTLADGVTPTLEEAAAAGRIRAAFPKDELKLIPKVKR